MSNALIAAVESMQNDMRRMETVSQNMVNIATPGYKRAIPVTTPFSAAMDAAGMPQAMNASATATGVSALTSVLDMSAGAVKHTGKPWDLAISGEGFFEVATPEGLAYTRAGDFRLDARGRLVTQNGMAVQGLQGELVMNGPNASVDHSGKITQDGEVVGQLKLVRFADMRTLTKNGTGLLMPAAGSAAPLAAQPELQVGFLESSNVTPMREMVSMMETTRHFEAAQKMFQGYDDKLASAIQKLGQF